MKPRDYCCCAIPVLNVGIYLTLLEQFTLGLLVGILAIATPSIVGASVPSFTSWVLAIVCFVAAAMQVFGFLGVLQEKAIMFRRYTTIHILLTVAAFAVALTWIIISATKHSKAVSTCETNFYSNSTSDSTLFDIGNESHLLCNIFSWVTLGLMGGLWLILAVMQLYLYTVVSAYGTGQRRDHEKYNSLYSAANYNNDIPMATNRGEPWDARPSSDDGDVGYIPGHGRNGSTASVSTILGEKAQEPRAFGYSDAAPVASTGYPPQPQRKATNSSRAGSVDDRSYYSQSQFQGRGQGAYYDPPQRQATYASSRMGSIDERGGYVSQPSAAYTQQPQPTPTNYDSYYTGGYAFDNANVDRPSAAQQHPEGVFGRKGTRLQKTERGDL